MQRYKRHSDLHTVLQLYSPFLHSHFSCFTPHPLQADPVDPSTDATPPRHLSLLQVPLPADLLAPDTIVSLEPLDALLALLPDGAPPHVDDAEALDPLASVIAPNRRTSMVL